jgi:hypothetical protein
MRVKIGNTEGLIELNASVPASRPTGEARAKWLMQAISRRLTGMNHFAMRYLHGEHDSITTFYSALLHHWAARFCSLNGNRILFLKSVFTTFVA